MKKNITVEKSYLFALEIISLYKQIKRTGHIDIARQVLRSGTSIGANVQEAQGAQSGRDFINKLSISFKEVKETKYWLRLIKDSRIIDSEQLSSLLSECTELEKMISSTILTMKSRV